MPGRSALALVACVLVLTVPAPTAAKEFAVRGMVLKVDAASRTFFVSHEKIVGLMDAMTMPFEVRDAKELESLAPGAIVEFTLVVGDSSAYATGIRVRRYESAEQDPFTARRLALLKKVAGTATTPLAVGARVPDFTLIDQTRCSCCAFPADRQSRGGELHLYAMRAPAVLPSHRQQFRSAPEALLQRAGPRAGLPDDYIRPRA